MADGTRDSGLIGISEIAEIAKVGPSAVSNWRKRHDNFPKPRLDTPSGVLFDLDEVEAWLREEEKIDEPVSAARRLWAIFEGLRGSLTTDEAVDLLRASLVYLVACDRNEKKRDLNTLPQSLWTHVRDQEDFESAIGLAAIQLGADNDELSGLLDPLIELGPSPKRQAEVRSMFDALSAALESGADPSKLFDQLTRAGVTGGGIQASVHVTPDSQVDLVTSLIDRQADSVLDLAAGEGGLLLKVSEASQAERAIGYEKTRRAAVVLRSRFFVSGRMIDLRVQDTLRERQYNLDHADVVVCDPPFSLKGWGDAEIYRSERWDFGEVPPSRGDFAWIQLSSILVNSGGSGYCLSPVGTLFRDGPERRIREEMIRRGVVEAIIALPGGLKLETGIPMALWVLRSASRPVVDQDILMIDGESLVEKGRSQNRLSEESISRISSIVSHWRDTGEVQDGESDIAVVVAPDAVKEGDLFPRTYLKSDPVDPGVLLAERERVALRLRALLPIDEVDLGPNLQLLSKAVPNRLLSDIAAISRARSLSKSDYAELSDSEEGRIPVLGVAELSGRPPRYLAPDHDLRGIVRLEPGDVVFAPKVQGVAATVVEQEPGEWQGAALGPGTWLIRATEPTVLPEWIYSWVLSDQFFLQLSHRGSGTMGPRVSAKELSMFSIPLPSIQVQREVGQSMNRLARMTDKASRVSKELRRLQSLESSIVFARATEISE